MGPFLPYDEGMERRKLFSMLGGATLTGSLTGQSKEPQVLVRTVHNQLLPKPFSGWEARFVEVQFPAGVKSTPHRHPGFVLGYVLEGAFLFGLNGEAPRILRAGEAFYEPPGAHHTAGESAGDSAARILAIIIAPLGQS